MMRSLKKQVISSKKNTEIKYPKGDRMFVGCRKGYLQEFSIISKTIVYDFGLILDDDISSMVTTLENKS